MTVPPVLNDHSPDVQEYAHEPERVPGIEWEASEPPSPTDAQVRSAMDRCREYLTVFTGLLGLGDWTISVSYDRTSFDHYNEATAAKVETDSWPYKLAGITVFLGVVYDYKNEQLRHLIAHELCHLLVKPLAEYGPGSDDKHFKNTVERTVENVARAVLAAYDAERPQTEPPEPGE